MPARLDPAERERRRKERVKRSFSDAAYQHYDAKTDGYGNAEDWKGTANARFGVEPVVEISVDLMLLGLTKMPVSRRDLTAAYRAASKAAHPDAGGSDAAFTALTEAYERLGDKFRHAT